VDITGFISTHRKSLLAGFFILVIVFLATFPVYGGISDVRVLTAVLTFVILAASWAMFSGTTGYMSLAPAAFFGLGMYTMCVLEKELPFPVIIIAGGLVAFAFALLIGLVTLRLKGIYFAIFTFGLVVFMSELINYLEIAIRNAHGWHIAPLSNTMLFYTMLGLAVVTVLAIYFINRSRLGLAMRSIGGNEEAAEHMGINTTRVKVLTFAISSTFMAAAGVITAPIWIYINSNIAFSLYYSFMPILMAVFGGMGHLYGPIIGAVVFAYLERIVRNEFPDYFMIGFGTILVVVILFLPNGLAGLVPTLQERLRRLTARVRRGDETEQHANT
jgi:branched-chain amino acid transport system permease protein